jgi:hypothetical protein
MILKRPVTSEDYVEWSVDDANKKVIRILGVSNIIRFYFLYLIFKFSDYL